jgi:hypothetical protein
MESAHRPCCLRWLCWRWFRLTKPSFIFLLVVGLAAVVVAVAVAVAAAVDIAATINNNELLSELPHSNATICVSNYQILAGFIPRQTLDGRQH